MKEQLITLKTAKLAKTKGFKPDKPSVNYVSMYINGKHSEGHEEDWDRGDFYLAPTQALLQKWLREKHGIEVNMYTRYDPHEDTRDWGFTCFYLNQKDNHTIIEDRIAYNSYEKALESGLKAALKMI